VSRRSTGSAEQCRKGSDIVRISVVPFGRNLTPGSPLIPPREASRTRLMAGRNRKCPDPLSNGKGIRKVNIGCRIQVCVHGPKVTAVQP
jgi:hypothetical protein